MTINYVDYCSLNISDFDTVVVGSGFAGSVCARELAERGNKKVLILEKRPHIGGNMYDEFDEFGVLVHRYGPHIFHSNDKRAYDYICRFVEMSNYQHEVLANVHGTYMPVPFNKNSMKLAFGEEKADHLTKKLIDKFGDERKVTITELRAQDDPELAEIADYVYNNVFLYYTQKQWGLTPDEVDPSVVARVPVFISTDNRYFQDKYQGMPQPSYTACFESMLDHENITICLNTDAASMLELDFDGSGEDALVSSIKLKDEEVKGDIIYTGPLDELFIAKFGRLPYRTLDFVYETYDEEKVLPCATVNYTVSEDYTRITEFKQLTGQVCKNTTIMKEYSKAYTDPTCEIPYYAILNDENNAHYERYRSLMKNMTNFHPLGRLAEYKYYNMDKIISLALDLSDELLK
ncbi:UDP-galactopyranose mutase [Phoenicibacter congonensis]|uniref:UDP-galactopyranose mutase n=1 Tax=Phoenicibacter congonensis TaxID=1944646 RepID=UPI0009A6D788|nr:UDP-galactopyranose mutase [Phoenicibacter congonensis]